MPAFHALYQGRPSNKTGEIKTCGLPPSHSLVLISVLLTQRSGFLEGLHSRNENVGIAHSVTVMSLKSVNWPVACSGSAVIGSVSVILNFFRLIEPCSHFVAVYEVGKATRSEVSLLLFAAHVSTLKFNHGRR